MQTVRHMFAPAYTTFLIVTAFTLSGCAVVTSHSSTEPGIIRVSQWGGTVADETLAQPHAINRVTLHHQGVAFPRERDPRQYLRDLQTWSRQSKGWIDVPYHYVIDLDGRVYEGRDIRFSGDTNTSYDPTGHALIEVVGDFELVEPNGAQLSAVVSLMASLAAKYGVPVEDIRGHRDYAPDTECPGKNLYRYLQNGYFHAQVRARMAVVKIR